MCLKIRGKIGTAKSDIIIYVIRSERRGIRSPFHSIEWKLGFVYEDFKQEVIDDSLVGIGFFHSFKRLKDARKLILFGEVYQATIPKGSRYKLGTITLCDQRVDGCEGYISKQLRLNKKWFLKSCI